MKTSIKIAWIGIAAGISLLFIALNIKPPALPSEESTLSRFGPPEKFQTIQEIIELRGNGADTATQEDFNDIYQEALKAAEQDNWLEVERLTRQLLAVKHYDSTPFSAMATVYLDYYNRPEQAVESCLQGLMEFPDDRVLSDYAMEIISRHNVDLKQLDPKLMSQVLGRGEQERFLAHAAENAGDYNEAIERLNHFIQYRKTDIHREYRSLARVYLKQGDSESALRYYRISRDLRSIYPNPTGDREEAKSFALEYLDVINKYGSPEEHKQFLEQLGNNPADSNDLAAVKAPGKA